MTDIEGELEDQEPSQEVATRSDTAGALAVFNPLDAEPVSFSNSLARRQDNYDQLRLHLMGVLVPGKDFGKIHVKKDCEHKYSCTNPHHFSGNELFAPGADKILGILGLAVQYPDMQDYKRAVLKGMKLEEVITDAEILGHNGQVIASGAGACERREVQGSLNNMVKRAGKRARLDAVKRLPVVSALFEDEFLDQVEQNAKANKNNTAASRVHKVRNKWDTGATLEVCPIGQEIKGKPWHEIDTGALEWLVANVTDKPDVHRAASRELSKRSRAAEPGSIRTSAPADFPDE